MRSAIVLVAVVSVLIPAAAAPQVPQTPTSRELARLQALAKRLQACGDDVVCIDRVSQEFPDPPSDAPPFPAPEDVAKIEAQARKIQACGTDLACLEAAHAELTHAMTQASDGGAIAVGTGWKPFHEHRPCSVVPATTCCLPVWVAVDNQSEYRLEPMPGRLSGHTLFTWRGDGRGELIYPAGFERFRLVAFGTPASTEVRRLTGFVETEASGGRLGRRSVPNLPAQPRDPFTLGIDYPAEPGSSTNIVFRGAEVETADPWMPTYRGSDLSGGTDLKESFVVTPARVRSAIEAGSLSKSFEWLEGAGTSITQQNRLDLEIRIGELEEIRKEEFGERACPEKYGLVAAYESRLELSSGRLVIVVRIQIRRRVLYRRHRITAGTRLAEWSVWLEVGTAIAGGSLEAVALPLPKIDELRQRWEQEIETMWNDRFEIDCGCNERPLRLHFDVQFVDHGGHHQVDVVPGAGRSAADLWYEKERRGVVAHEFGHLLGLEDEYPDTDCPRRPVSGDGSVMNDHRTGVPKKRHVEQFARWLSRRGGGVCRVRTYRGGR